MTISLLQLPALAAELSQDSASAQFGAGALPPYVAFSPSIQQFATWMGPLPSQYEPGVPLSIIVEWRSPEVQATSARAIMQASIVGLPVMDNIDSALASLGTAVEVELAPDWFLPIAVEDLGRRHQYAHFDFLTSAELNAVQPNQLLFIQLTRVTGDAADTHVAQIEVLGIHVVTDLFDPLTFDILAGITLQWYHDVRDFSSLTFSGTEVVQLDDQSSKNFNLIPNTKGPDYDAAAVGGRPGLRFEQSTLEAPQSFILDQDFTGVVVFTPTNELASADEIIASIQNVFEIRLDVIGSAPTLDLIELGGDTTIGGPVITAEMQLPIIAIWWYDFINNYMAMRINGKSPGHVQSFTLAPGSVEIFQYGEYIGEAPFYLGLSCMYASILTVDQQNDIFLRLAAEYNVKLEAPLYSGPLGP